MEERYCTECRAAIPKGESVCPACGVYAGDVFDGKLPKRRASRWLWVLAVVTAVVAALWIVPMEERRPRPSGHATRLSSVKSERDAMVTLRRFLTTSDRDVQCVALIGKGRSGGAYIIAAVDRCKHTQMGVFAVDAKGNVTKR
jgi:predicted nucleic acid-binding Zn ribbon protein